MLQLALEQELITTCICPAVGFTKSIELALALLRDKNVPEPRLLKLNQPSIVIPSVIDIGAPLDPTSTEVAELGKEIAFPWPIGVPLNLTDFPTIGVTFTSTPETYSPFAVDTCPDISPFGSAKPISDWIFEELQELIASIL